MPNYIVITAVKSILSPLRSEGYKYSIQSWKRWCSANGAELRVLEQLLYDVEYMKPNYFRYYCFDLLAEEFKSGDKICLVDADTIIHPKCPNFFDLVNDDFGCVLEDGDFDWIIRSIENYQNEFAEFSNFNFDIWRYFNSGFIVINESHKKLCADLISFYLQKRDKIVNYNKKYGVGTDQPLINLLVQQQNTKVQILPYQFNMTSLQRKNILDDRMLFTNIHGIYHFNAVEGGPEMVNYWLHKTFNFIEND